jgi:murein DD-endopeptidase MepM/ murein hydrolase activator NlpD
MSQNIPAAASHSSGSSGPHLHFEQNRRARWRDVPAILAAIRDELRRANRAERWMAGRN